MPNPSAAATSVTLYSISETLVELLDSLDLCDTDEARAECEADIERTVAQQLRKVDDFCRFLAHLDSQTDLAAREIARVRERLQALTRLQNRLENYAIRTMHTWNQKVLDGETSQLRLRRNPPAVEITAEDLIPNEFRRTIESISIDKRLIKKAIDEGVHVPGARLRWDISLVRK